MRTRDLVGRAFKGCGKTQNAIILSPPRRAENPSLPFGLNTEGFFAPLRMTAKGLFPKRVQWHRKRFEFRMVAQVPEKS